MGGASARAGVGAMTRVSDGDTEARAPGCQCHLEAGDSLCPIHGDTACDRCGTACGAVAQRDGVALVPELRGETARVVSVPALCRADPDATVRVSR